MRQHITEVTFREFSFYRHRYYLCSLIHLAFLSEWDSCYSLTSLLIEAERKTQQKESYWHRQQSAVHVWSAVVRDDNASLRLPCSWLFPFFCSFFSLDSSACLMSAGCLSVWCLLQSCIPLFFFSFSCHLPRGQSLHNSIQHKTTVKYLGWNELSGLCVLPGYFVNVRRREEQGTHTEGYNRKNWVSDELGLQSEAT